jgi:hypothetical protein
VREVVRHFHGEGTHGVHEGRCMVDLLPLVEAGSGKATRLPIVVSLVLSLSWTSMVSICGAMRG